MWTTIAEAWQNTESFGNYNSDSFYGTNYSEEKKNNFDEPAVNEPAVNEPVEEEPLVDSPPVSFKDSFKQNMTERQYGTPFSTISNNHQQKMLNKMNKYNKKGKEKFSILNKKCDFLNRKIEQLTENFEQLKKKQKSIETFNNNQDKLFNKNSYDIVLFIIFGIFLILLLEGVYRILVKIKGRKN